MLDSPASKPTTRANSKSKLLGPTQVGSISRQKTFSFFIAN
jgi:hypothetical protein